MLKIKDEVDLKELEKFGFKYIESKEATHDYIWGSKKESYYTEKKYIYDNSVNIIEILEERKGSDWIHANKLQVGIGIVRKYARE